MGDHSDSKVLIYFSDCFNIDPRLLEEYGAFNISLINDLPLFVDPFLLFTSPKPEYQLLHDEVIGYLRFLVSKARAGGLSKGDLSLWFSFKEVKENWLGYSDAGNAGRGPGPKFAEALVNNLATVFRNFGDEKIARGSHLEKVCLIDDGVGRDNISDVTVCLIKDYLLSYTQTFTLQHFRTEQIWSGQVQKCNFNFSSELWEAKSYSLPRWGDSYVILTPKDILTRDDTWISRNDLLENFEQIALALPDEVLRAQLNHYFFQRVIYHTDATKEERATQKKVAVNETLREFPEVIEHYIRSREDTGDLAVSVSSEEVQDVQQQFVVAVKFFVAEALQPTEFYSLPSDSYEEIMRRLLYFKDIIESRDGYRLFYHTDQPITRESDLRLIFKFTWFGTKYNFDAEVNNGRGPVDFKASFGAADSALLDFKLASNTKLKSSLEKQLVVYEKANATHKSIWAICYFSASELARVEKILRELGRTRDPSIVLIDCRNDNKPSASTS